MDFFFDAFFLALFFLVFFLVEGLAAILLANTFRLAFFFFFAVLVADELRLRGLHIFL